MMITVCYKSISGPELSKFNQFDQWVDWCEERIKRLGLNDVVEDRAEMNGKPLVSYSKLIQLEKLSK